jgi:outer membrane protein assembly factor BamB
MIKRYQVVCVFFLLIISSIGSLSFGNKLSEKINPIDNYNTFQPLDGPMDSAWPMQSHDLQHTGRSQYSTANNSGIEKWRFRCEHMDAGMVIDVDNTIYFGVQNRYIYAVFPNGTLKWRFYVSNWIWSTPAIDEDGTIYVGSWDTKLYAINPNGTQKWAVGTGGSIASSPAIGEDGTIYIGHVNNNIVAVNPNGTIKWSYPTGNRIYSDPCIGDDGTIYIGSDDTYLYAMNPNGTLKWRFKTGDVIKAPPSIADDGTIYIGSYDDYLYALYPNGTMKWKCPIGYGTALNPSIASDGTIYVGWDRLYAVYPNGTIKWIFNMGEDRHIDTSSPAISADGTVYFGTNIGDAGGGEIIAVNSNGTEKWRKMIADEWVDSSPAIAEDGTIYIGSLSVFGGYLHAFGSVESNAPPEAPTILGESNGKVGVKYLFIFNSIDPDRNPISLYIDWGDGSNGWTRECASGEDLKFEHSWSDKGNYTIRAKAKDVFNEESNWTEFEIKITNPRNRISFGSLFFRFLEPLVLLYKMRIRCLFQ